jgi:PhnB protein
MPPKPIPKGYHTLTPYVAVDDATKAIEFYKRAFGAKERVRMPGPNDTVAHAELEIGDSLIMLSDPFPQSSIKTPKELGGTTGATFMYVEDVDEVVQQAIDAGATVTMPVEKQFWGDRYGKVADPFGHEWQIATHVEDLTPEEIEKRGQEAMAAMS